MGTRTNDDRKTSDYREDKRLENIINTIMEENFYTKGEWNYYRYIEDEEIQDRGIDLILGLGGTKRKIDEKAQVKYATNPLQTFALELMNTSSKKIGWFLDDYKETEYYMFLWPKAEKKRFKKDDVISIDYALVKRKKLKELVYTGLGIDESKLLYYVDLLRKREIGIEHNGLVRYKDHPFNKGMYLVYTLDNNLAEAPINLVIRKKDIEWISYKKGTIQNQIGVKNG